MPNLDTYDVRKGLGTYPRLDADVYFKYFEHWKPSPMAEVKFRAEVKLRADCGGPAISDTYDTRKSSNDNPDDTVGNLRPPPRLLRGIEGADAEPLFLVRARRSPPSLGPTGVERGTMIQPMRVRVDLTIDAGYVTYASGAVADHDDRVIGIEVLGLDTETPSHAWSFATSRGLAFPAYLEGVVTA